MTTQLRLMRKIVEIVNTIRIYLTIHGFGNSQ